MRAPRLVRLTALSLTALTALVGCGAGAPSASVEGTATIASAPATTTTVAVTADSTVATTAAATTTAVAETTTASSDPATTVAETAPGTTATTAAPTGPVTSVAASADRAVLVARLFNSIGYPLSDPEAACLAQYTSQPVLDALAASGDAAVEGAIAAGLVQALARCEPETFMAEQDDITMQDYKVDAAAARCVTKALDAAAVQDATIALAYWEGTNGLTSALQQQLIGALTPCVGKDKATEIITQ